METKSIIYKIFTLAVLVFLLIPSAFAEAALLGISGSSKVSAGQSFTVSVDVNSQGEAINNVEAVVGFPASLLEVVSLQNGPVLTIWAETPTFSNATGRVSFNGGVPNPGFTGTGNVLKIRFKAKASGNAAINFSSAFVRANDGLGTNVLRGSSGLSLAIEQAVTEPAPTPTPTPAPQPTPQPIPPAPVEPPALEPGQLIRVEVTPQNLLVGQPVKITGQTLIPNAKLNIYFNSDQGNTWMYNYVADNFGKIEFVGEPFGAPGKYNVWIKSSPGEVNVFSTPVTAVNVKRSVFNSTANFLDSIPSGSMFDRILLALLLLLAIIGWGMYLRNVKLNKLEQDKLEQDILSQLLPEKNKPSGSNRRTVKRKTAKS